MALQPSHMLDQARDGVVGGRSGRADFDHETIDSPGGDVFDPVGVLVEALGERHELHLRLWRGVGVGRIVLSLSHWSLLWLGSGRPLVLAPPAAGRSIPAQAGIVGKCRLRHLLAEAAAVKAMASGSQHRTMRAISHRIARSLSVSVPISSAT